MGGMFVEGIAAVAKRYDVSEAFPCLSPPPHPSLSSHHGTVTVNGREESVPHIGLFWKIACKCRGEKLKLCLLPPNEPERLTQESCEAADPGLHFSVGAVLERVSRGKNDVNHCSPNES